MVKKVSQVDVSTLQERVYQELREALSQGRFAAGEAVTIRGLAADLGTSPMPVREALQRLVAEKALVQAPNRSIRVAPFTLERFTELTRIRMLIEGYAARQAAMTAKPSLVRHLTDVNEAMREAVAEDDAETALDTNKTFHFDLYEAAAMPQLMELITGLWMRSGPYLAMTFQSIPEAPDAFETGTRIHDRVIAAVDCRNGDRARSALALDIWATARWFKAHYSSDAALDPSRPGYAEGSNS